MAERHVRMEQHWLACMASAGDGAKVTRFKGAMVVSNERVSGTFLNFIFPWEADAGSLPVLLEFGSALLAGNGRQPALFLTPAAGNQDALAEALVALGWRRQTRQVALACDLSQPRPEPPDLIVVDEIGPGRLNVWGSTLVRAYEVSPAAGREIRAGWTSLMRSPGEASQARFYLARLGGKPVATGLTWSRGEIAGFYCGAVLPDFRRRGVERATITRRMADAARDGRRLGMLQTEAGSPVEHLCVQHLGFQREYFRELWVPGSDNHGSWG